MGTSPGIAFMLRAYSTERQQRSMSLAECLTGAVPDPLATGMRIWYSALSLGCHLRVPATSSACSCLAAARTRDMDGSSRCWLESGFVRKPRWCSVPFSHRQTTFLRGVAQALDCGCNRYATLLQQACFKQWHRHARHCCHRHARHCCHRQQFEWCTMRCCSRGVCWPSSLQNVDVNSTLNAVA